MILRSAPSRPLYYVWLFLFAVTALSAAATDYTISLVSPESHLIEVQITLPPGSSQRQLQLPVWNALYQVRDFSQYVNWLHAKDVSGNSLGVKKLGAQELDVQKLNKSSWQISGAQNGVVVEYQIFADASGPFGAQFNSHHAFFNLAEILMYPVELRDRPMTVSFRQIPAGWLVATPLTQNSESAFTAENYDRLVDSPVEIGRFQESDFEEGGAHYRVIVDAESSDYDMEKILTMLRKIVRAATGWMEDRPFERYMFLYHFPRGPAGGGMEHAYSTAIALNAEVLHKAPDALASVTAHEFFHLWNVKRIRPQSLEPVDYTKENFTRALWFSEGCTSTAADIIQLRSGILDESRFRQDLAAGIGELERRPAHLTQSAEESSLDAWLEGDAYYRDPQRSITYYNKGELLGVMLDLAVREASRGEASLREVFRWMNETYAHDHRFFPDSAGARQAAESVSHADLGWFFTKYVSGTDEIPWDDFLHTVGLQLKKDKRLVLDAGFAAARNFDGPMLVESVASGEAVRAGLQAGDTILEINGKTPGQQVSPSLAGMNPGDTITTKIKSRRGAERELKWKLGSREEVSYELKDAEGITPVQRSRRAAWLKGEAEGPSPR